MKRTNTVADVLNTGTAKVDFGDGVILNLPLDGIYAGEQGPPGVGVPAGGAALQVVRKDAAGIGTEWATTDKALVGLSNVDNTSDAGKPISEQQAAVNAGKVSKVDLGLFIKDYGAIGDGITEDTEAFQDVADLGGIVHVPAGVYIVRSVSVTKDLRLICADGVVFKRPANADVTQGSYWSTPDIAMFAVDVTGVDLVFDNFTFDGNNTNQPATTPFGLFLKCLPIGTITAAPTNITINKGVFTNGTSGYMVLRGDDVQRRYETNVFLNDCRFHETLTGIGMNDPASPNSLGYGPSYILALDFVRLTTSNFYADWVKDVSATGDYSVCAINLSYYGGSSSDSGEASLYMHGTTHFKNLGRATKQWDNDALFTNNAIGVIDAYGNAETLYIENVKAENSKFVTIRAKASLKFFTVKNATLENCDRGLQVSPSTTGAAETVVSISNVTTTGGVVPAVECVGTSATDRLKSVAISNVNVEDIGQTAETVAGGAVIVSNSYTANLETVTIDGAPFKGISLSDIAYVFMNSINIANVGTEGIDNGNAVDVCKQIQLTDFHIENCGSHGVKINNGLKKLFINDGYIVTAVNYGVYVGTSLAEVFVSSVTIDGITGTGRAFYVLNGECTFVANKVLNTTTPLFTGTTARKREQHNSWNPAEYQGTAAPTTGTWVVGDKVHNTAPAAGGTVGWVCTTAGTPGTWKTFGTIAA